MRRSLLAAAAAAAIGIAAVPVGVAADGRPAAQIGYAAARVHAVERDLDFFVTDTETLVRSCAAARRDETRGKLQTLAAETATMAGNFAEGPNHQLALLRGRLHSLLAGGTGVGVTSARLQAARLLDAGAAAVQAADARIGVALAAAGRGDCRTANRAWSEAQRLQAALAQLDGGLRALRAAG